MKFNPDAYAEYPILRPNSRDYPNGSIEAALVVAEPKPDSDSVEFSIEFHVNEPAISKHISDGAAVCCAQVYCRATCYTVMLKADPGGVALAASIPRGDLNERVEIHPSVITVKDIDLKLDAAHPEYGDGSIQVSKRKQIAAAAPWYLAVGFSEPLQSVFQIAKDETSALEDGEYDFETTPQDKYIIISANPDTYEAFSDIRESGNIPLTSSTVYLNALTEAISRLPEEPHDDEHSAGWARTVRERMRLRKLNVFGEHSYGLAAQRLLGSPLIHLKAMNQEIS